MGQTKVAVSFSCLLIVRHRPDFIHACQFIGFDDGCVNVRTSCPVFKSQNFIVVSLLPLIRKRLSGVKTSVPM
jgi:hypothetical protein